MYQRASSIMYSTPLRIVVTFFTFAANDLSGIHIAERRILPARNEERKIFLRRGGHHPTSLSGSISWNCFEFAGAQKLVEKFVREETLSRAVRLAPIFHYDALDAAHGFFFGDAGIGDAIEVMAREAPLPGGGEMTIVRHALVVIVRDEIV